MIPSRAMRLPAVMIAAAAAAVSATPCAAARAASAPAPSAILLGHLERERVRIASDIEVARLSLEERARRDAPRLLPRLGSRTDPRARGYGVLPAIEADEDTGPVSLKETRYSIEALQADVAGARAEASDLREAALDPTRPLPEVVEAFERARSGLKRLEDRLSYHSYWQKALQEWPGYFQRQNEVIALAHRLRDAEASGDRTGAAGLRREIAGRLAPFVPTPGLALRPGPGGDWVLPVRLLTDIQDETFLETFRTAVRRAFDESDAASAAHFSVDLDIERISPDSLYPDGVPRIGSPVDPQVHLARFPKDALVLTTGGESTHSFTGHYIQLGPEPVTPRTLAHEFAHLLGFSDAYLRGFEGDPMGPTGAIIVEWSGLQDDIMGSPGRGLVTDEMIGALVQAYLPVGLAAGGWEGSGGSTPSGRPGS